MSYSFNVRAADKATVLDHVSAQFDSIVSGQPIHTTDRDAASDAVASVLELVPGNDESDFSVSVSGSIMTTNDVVTAIGVSVNVSLVAREGESSLDSGGGGHGDPDGPK